MFDMSSYLNETRLAVQIHLDILDGTDLGKDIKYLVLL
jgi:hypothetical protein